MEYILQTHNLTKRYGNHKAVNNVNMHVKQGDIYGFIGKNGAGKTTFLKMVCGMASISDGTIELYGKTGKEADKMHRKIGALIEAPGIYPGMNAYENMKIKCLAAGINSKEYIENILKNVGLGNVKNKKVNNFSLGMKQRLGIGMALIGEPEILLLDEPINGLDPQGIVEVRDTIHKLNAERKITIIISSHILSELSKIATVYGIINNGILINELTNDELQNKCRERIVLIPESVDAAIPVLKKMGFTKYACVDPATIEIYERFDEIPDMIMQLSSDGIRLLSVYTKTDDIEDYFINLTGGGKNE